MAAVMDLFLPDSDVGAFDIDDCRDATTEQIHPWAISNINWRETMPR